jgi:ribosomal-protein-alanine N-acetyltransferase
MQNCQCKENKRTINMIYRCDDKEIGYSFFGEEELNDLNYLQWFHDKDVTKHNSHGLFPYTENKKKQFLEEINEGIRIVFAIYSLSHPPRLIGNCSLQSINWINKSAEFAIVIGEKDFWGKGIGENALRVCLKHAFEKLGLNRVWTGTAITNIGMLHVAEKCGMRNEGVFKEAVFLNGMFEHVVEYGITRSRYDDVNK